MVLFPNAKINLGADVLRRRPDGYHDIESITLPVKWCDILEIVPAGGASAESTLEVTGSDLSGCPVEKNLVMKALLAVERGVRRLASGQYLSTEGHSGRAGLGGGSADAAFTITGLNDIFALGLSKVEMAEIAAGIGADCPFFIYDRPMLVSGTGTAMTPADISLDGVEAVAVVKPRVVSVSTARAYAGVTPRMRKPGETISSAISSGWRAAARSGVLVNDFEQSIFALCPEVAEVKRRMSELGAVYASMSGSGAAVYGFFESAKLAERAVAEFDGCDTFVSLQG